MLTPTVRRSRGLIPAVLLAALALGACGGGDDGSANDEGVASLDEPDAGTDDASTDASTPTATTEPVGTEEAMLAFAACMREHGIDMPDPQVDENGGVMIQIGGDGEAPAQGQGPSDEMQEAMDACRELMPQGPITRGGADFDPTEMQDQMLALAQCMREHGIDMPDPEFDENGGLATEEFDSADGSVPDGPVLRGPFGTLDMSDPATQAAFEECGEDSGFGPPGAGATVGAAPVAPQSDEEDGE